MDHSGITPVFSTNTFASTAVRRTHFATPLWRLMYTGALAAVDVVSIMLPLTSIFLIDSKVYARVIAEMSLSAFISVSALIWIVAMAIAGTYNRHVMEQGYILYSKIINGCALAIVLASCISFFLDLDLPRMAVIIAPVCAGIIDLFARWGMRLLLHRNRRNGECKYSTVIVGSEKGILEALELIQRRDELGYRATAYCPIARVDGEKDKYRSIELSPQAKVQLEGLREIPLNSFFVSELEKNKITEVFVTDTLTRGSQVLYALALAVESLGIELAMSIPVAGIGGHRLHLSNDSVQPILIAALPQYNRATALIRRCIDIIGSLVGIALFSWIMIAVAIAIKIDDPKGKVFFKQIRVGRRGELFTMLKFRSMYADAEQRKKQLAAETGQLDRFIFKLKDDPRVTRVGKFIRKYSLDELPQFFNVLMGSMSLVGPRPALPEEVERYSMVYSSRLLVKPGITGPWQVSGRSDLTREQSEFLDVSYIENWTLSGDLAILCKTVLAVLRGTGSY